MSLDSELAKVLEKFGILEEKVISLEEESRGQKVVIAELQTKLKNLKTTTRNEDKSSQENPGANLKPRLIEKIESPQNAVLTPVENDPNSSQNVVTLMGVRSDEETREILNRVENGHTSTSRRISSTPQVVVKNEKISSKPKPKRRVKKIYSCSECGKILKDNPSLKAHTRIHKGEKPFPCSVCRKSFRQATQRTKHLRTHNGLRPFPCTDPECLKRFADKTTLKNHIRTHTGEKPYTCPICQKSFAQITARDGHVRVHTHEKPYPCSRCGQTFSLSGNATRHENNNCNYPENST